jgi:hypothetical protein
MKETWTDSAWSGVVRVAEQPHEVLNADSTLCGIAVFGPNGLGPVIAAMFIAT